VVGKAAVVQSCVDTSAVSTYTHPDADHGTGVEGDGNGAGVMLGVGVDVDDTDTEGVMDDVEEGLGLSSNKDTDTASASRRSPLVLAPCFSSAATTLTPGASSLGGMVAKRDRVLFSTVFMTPDA
jgi:hypothetical protein